MFYSRLIRPLLFRCDPEWVHELAIHLLRYAPPLRTFPRAPTQPVRVWDRIFRNPLGLAAGFDKNGVMIRAAYLLGFGFTEIGTVTRHAQPGNPRPRIFRAPAQQALVNRLGFPNLGADRVAQILRQTPRGGMLDFPVGINIGKSKVTPPHEAAADYLYSFRALYEWGDFFVVNVSSPNTPGLRDLQAVELLRPILETLQEANLRHKPLLVKLSPDLTDDSLADLAALARATGLQGLVATNTTTDHSSIPLRETGGLSGAPLRARSTAVLRRLRALCGDLPLIGVGGVMDRASFEEKRQAGADLVQLYTGFVYQGPGTAWKIISAPLGGANEAAGSRLSDLNR